MKDKKGNVLDVISKLSNINFQKDVWVNDKYWDRILNFGEAVNTLDDYCFFDDIKSRILKFSKVIDQKKLEKFVKDLLDYEEDISNPDKMLEDPYWISITKEAKEVYDLLINIDWD